MHMNVSAMNLLRYVVAYVFIISGIMKFVSTELGNHFIHLGLPYPLTVMYVVAIVELICGALILMNKRVKKAAMPLLVIMIAAFLLTKVPLLHTGFFTFAFNARLDVVMLLLLFILYKSHHR
ncbi:MAG TPA: DoxX family membrane protein [Pseudoneobacillus sp.]|nr:DoxX family membrane protein [Pseudoneobacillus sp.]